MEIEKEEGAVMELDKLFRIFILANLVLILFFFSLAQAQTAQQIALEAFRSTVLLVMEDERGQPISLASGFFVREDIVATNLHVIEKASRGYAKIVGEKTKYNIAGSVGIDDKRDLALLSVTGGKAFSLILGDNSQVAVGDEIYVVGNPLGLEGTFSQGIISGIRQIGLDTLFQITAPISPGSSGGPVLNTQGIVIGVAVSTIRGGQNINFAIPTSYVTSLLSNIKPVLPLSVKKRPQKERSIIADLGGRSTDGVTGIRFEWGGILGLYTFSLHNQLRQPVKNIYCQIIFYDSKNNLLDFNEGKYEITIPPGLSKRVDGLADTSVKEILDRESFFGKIDKKLPQPRVEIRVLDFQIVD
ncbi:MAG: S1C family serine protease [Thermodesulfobacteriota bacterium]